MGIVSYACEFVTNEVESGFNFLLAATAWDADACEGLDSSGNIFAVFGVDKHVVIGISRCGFVFALIHLSRIIGGDSGVHDGWDGQGCVVLVDKTVEKCFYIGHAS